MSNLIKKVREAVKGFFEFIFGSEEEKSKGKESKRKKKVSKKLSPWTMDIVDCIERLDKKEFTLQEIYKFEEFLQDKHPENNHIQAKIRQELQKLRDNGYLEFVDNKGTYKVNYYFDD